MNILKSQSISLSHTHTYIHTHTHSLSLSHSLSHTHTRTLSLFLPPPFTRIGAIKDHALIAEHGKLAARGRLYPVAVKKYQVSLFPSYLSFSVLFFTTHYFISNPSTSLPSCLLSIFLTIHDPPYCIYILLRLYFIKLHFTLFLCLPVSCLIVVFFFNQLECVCDSLRVEELEEIVTILSSV
jgi:hypothetical protein